MKYYFLRLSRINVLIKTSKRQWQYLFCKYLYNSSWSEYFTLTLSIWFTTSEDTIHTPPYVKNNIFDNNEQKSTIWLGTEAVIWWGILWKISAIFPNSWRCFLDNVLLLLKCYVLLILVTFALHISQLQFAESQYWKKLNRLNRGYLRENISWSKLEKKIVGNSGHEKLHFDRQNEYLFPLLSMKSSFFAWYG